MARGGGGFQISYCCTRRKGRNKPSTDRACARDGEEKWCGSTCHGRYETKQTGNGPRISGSVGHPVAFFSQYIRRNRSGSAHFISVHFSSLQFVHRSSWLTLRRSMKPTFSSAESLNTHSRCWCPDTSVPSLRLRLPFPPTGVDPPLGVLSELLPSSESSRFREEADLEKSQKKNNEEEQIMRITRTSSSAEFKLSLSRGSVVLRCFVLPSEGTAVSNLPVKERRKPGTGEEFNRKWLVHHTQATAATSY